MMISNPNLCCTIIRAIPVNQLVLLVADIGESIKIDIVSLHNAMKSGEEVNLNKVGFHHIIQAIPIEQLGLIIVLIGEIIKTNTVLFYNIIEAIPTEKFGLFVNVIADGITSNIQGESGCFIDYSPKWAEVNSILNAVPQEHRVAIVSTVLPGIGNSAYQERLLASLPEYQQIIVRHNVPPTILKLESELSGYHSNDFPVVPKGMMHLTKTNRSDGVNTIQR